MFSLDEINAGLKSQEFFLEYLPTMSLSDNRCVGAETLIRWRHGDRVVPPLEFIPLVENTPLSGTLTYWVLETVAKELGGWMRDHDGIHISINVPPELLGRGGLRYTAEKSNLLANSCWRSPNAACLTPWAWLQSLLQGNPGY
jgi:sensor c-di-GMP phosphodiesterase-like protein